MTPEAANAGCGVPSDTLHVCLRRAARVLDIMLTAMAPVRL
jgi:hypothetical protein